MRAPEDVSTRVPLPIMVRRSRGIAQNLQVRAVGTQARVRIERTAIGASGVYQRWWCVAGGSPLWLLPPLIAVTHLVHLCRNTRKWVTESKANDFGTSCDTVPRLAKTASTKTANPDHSRTGFHDEAASPSLADRLGPANCSLFDKRRRLGPVPRPWRFGR